MKRAGDTVVEVQVVPPGQPLRGDAIATVPAREGDKTFDVPAELEAELEQSFAEADAGRFLSADEVLRRLRQPA